MKFSLQEYKQIYLQFFYRYIQILYIENIALKSVLTDIKKEFKLHSINHDKILTDPNCINELKVSIAGRQN